ncbi:MCE-family protein Mce1A [Pseudonocardia sp. Ae406_Ps2]|uniref:MCE family protein n=1 Tax=unclassified Pseudonocardia TaxID=2619320 RepID=UPI000314A7EA|nr:MULTISPECIES: MCE family protein [unclassified Pseudonocardia]OLL96939.1 MCE-family protein Mce1A [Pseudonocardia sp. Ae331_Ps2]OLM05349.1 MCE-family protein Mce1A [Pseudonocardia sp. Ae406_Ps2]OLM15700.1 MCE-family protein Mce1A [Pseudonocardia sp. Ae505_Ps2]OLM26920.1 MCE-family protein Mce1A [Pseudonocardia sp. Ae706_Ps2]
MNDSFFTRFKYRVYALILIGVVLGFLSLCTAMYLNAFADTVPVTLKADRSGLQMYPGNRVQLKGVDVGKVGSVSLADGDRGAVDIVLDMDADRIGQVPADARVSLDQLTAFGAKTVQLTMPATPSGRMLAAGDQIATDSVTVEVNTLFDSLDRILDTLGPREVSEVIGNLATALDGRGEQVGETASQLAAYLKRFNANLPQLQTDFRKGADLANLYGDVAGDLVTVLDNGAVTSRTIVEQQADLESFLFQISRVSRTGEAFFLQNRDGIRNVTQTALPTTELLRDYSPMFACWLKGLDKSRQQLEQQQGNTVPGFVGLVTLEPGDTPYTSPPVVGADNGPDCHGMPDLDGSVFPESLMKNVDKGGEPNPDGDNTLRIGDPPLVTQLFGPFAGAGQELGLPGEQVRSVPGGQPAPAPVDPAAPVPAAPGTESAPPAAPRESGGFLGGLFGGEGGR